MKKEKEPAREDIQNDELLSEREELLKAKAAVEEEMKSLAEDVARARADFYNYRMRVERDLERDRKLAAEQAISQLLPVLENLERICESADKDSQLYKGMAMIADQFSSVLCGLGLEPICTEGRFDPNVHEAVTMEPVEDESKDDFILGTLRKGYKLAGKVIRAAQVRVGKFVK